MSASVVLFVIVVLGTASAERCRDYTDVFGNSKPGFSCPTYSDLSSDVYCCGVSDLPMCCSSCLLSQYSPCDADDIIDLSIGAIVGIAVGCVVLVAIIITVCCCCCCACCAGCCRDPAPTTTVIANQPAAGVTVAQTTYPGQPYPQYPPSGELSQYPPPGAQYPPPGQQYPPQQGGLVYPPAYPGPMKQ
ncbi:PREDICTED: protein shisa-5-like [Branchiostoma belcheri]|uniref:Protein shisa-5-like n=1 Tax=Branchiostoma belcheri TaxID=7741 RepID=A0A6P4ZS95_BRABE|nr:PREDICTED: protein shisa-5-like [Branchiostoma belcheri]